MAEFQRSLSASPSSCNTLNCSDEGRSATGRNAAHPSTSALAMTLIESKRNAQEEFKLVPGYGNFASKRRIAAAGISSSSKGQVQSMQYCASCPDRRDLGSTFTQVDDAKMHDHDSNGQAVILFEKAKAFDSVLLSLESRSKTEGEKNITAIVSSREARAQLHCDDNVATISWHFGASAHDIRGSIRRHFRL